ncbi:peptide chain release factor N(5)-glutamine methyltransferase [Pelagibacteraceae bacterium]|nr:peptide chain release factor N(5)-glutamine methyltransferase [Pelagibacteraceae bacterium]
MTLENIIKDASQCLKNYNIYSHQLDAQLILANILGVTREKLIINNNINISKKEKNKYDEAIRRRAKSEPVAYILGKKEFWSQDFLVNYSTLVPRPETELLIYKIINYFKNKKANILDIGTGSGCILLSILKELRKAKGIGIDVSSKAIKIAKENSINFGLSNRAKFKTIEVDKFYLGKYDLIVSNPPYIPSKDIKNLSKDIRNYEPFIALNGGTDGLDVIKKVIYKAQCLLKRKGLLAIEIGNGQYLEVIKLLATNGFRKISSEYDCNNNVRCIISTKV